MSVGSSVNVKVNRNIKIKQRKTIQYSIVQHNTVQRGALQRSAMQQYYTKQSNATQHNATHHNIKQNKISNSQCHSHLQWRETKLNVLYKVNWDQPCSAVAKISHGWPPIG